MKKELALEAPAHELAQPRAAPRHPPHPRASLARSPAAGTLRCIYYFPPIVWASPLPGRPSGPPSACIQPLS